MYQLKNYKGSIAHAKMAYVGALLRRIRAWIDNIDDFSIDAAADALADAKRIKAQAGALEAAVSEALMAAMHHEGRAFNVGSDYAVIMRPGTTQKNWDHAGVMQALIDSTSIRLQGRFPSVPEGVLEAIVTESMWQVHKVGSVKWRVGDLRDAGVEPDEFSEKVNAPPALDLRGEAVEVKDLGRRRRRPLRKRA